MRKVLIIAYLFPPRSGIGSQRPCKLAKYFQNFGWEPVILTAKLPGKHPEGIRVIETEYKDLVGCIKSKTGFRPEVGLHQQLGINVSKNFKYSTWKSKIIKFGKEVINFPDEQRNWYKYAIESGSEFLSKEKVDAIISTSYPVTSHLIARKLKQKYKIPWIADFRDPWSQNPYVNKFRVFEYFEKKLELRTIADADLLVTVTLPWIDLLKKLHKNKEVYCLTNGYDKDDFPKIPARLTDKFTITYAGTLYNGKRDPAMLFKVVASLINKNKIDNDLIEIRFYGPKEEWLVEEVKKYNLEKVVHFYGRIPREEVLERQRESQLLLLILWNNKKEEGFCPAKVYEYFGAGRPIIALGGAGSVIKGMLETTNSGKFAVDSDVLAKNLLEYYEEFTRYGEVKCHSNGNIEDYSYKSITEKYSQILNGLVF